jgi:hypothetical protein
MPSAIIEELDTKKPSFRPSKWPRKLKLLKIVNCQNCPEIVLSQLEKVGGHIFGVDRYPSWIICKPRFLFLKPERNLKSKLSFLRNFMNKENSSNLVFFPYKKL